MADIDASNLVREMEMIVADRREAESVMRRSLHRARA
jgi:uncharacterized protein YfcZ (UPF0381/DUF406 family)